MPWTSRDVSNFLGSDRGAKGRVRRRRESPMASGVFSFTRCDRARGTFPTPPKRPNLVLASSKSDKRKQGASHEVPAHSNVGTALDVARIPPTVCETGDTII